MYLDKLTGLLLPGTASGSDESGGGGGADVTLGRVNSDLNFQPLRFEGTDAFPDGDPVAVDTYYSWNTNGIVIAQSTVMLALEQYVETSIDLSQYVSAERSVSFSAGTLPAGLTLNDSVISGNPTVFGDFTVNITASSHGASDKTFILVLNIAETEIVLPDPLFYASFASESATAESGQELTVTGTPEYTTVQGIPCVKFDGTNYMTFPDTGLPAGTSARTMSCWCCVDSFSTYNNPMLLGYGTRASSQFSGIYLESSANYVLFSGYSAENNIQTASNTITTEKWYHIACTKNGENEKIYINGKLAIEGTSGKNTVPGLGQIADTTDSDSYRYDGALAACRIYDSELDSDQITILANEFTPTE